MTWIDGEWSGTHFILDRTETAWFHFCESRPGVYRLIASLSKEIVLPAPLNRVCGQDEAGTIYIGAARNVRVRVGSLVKQHSESYRSKNHKAMPGKLAEAFPPEHLAVCWHYVAEGIDVFYRENELVCAYKEAFGEPPPLNGQG